MALIKALKRFDETMPAPSVIQSFWEHLPILPVAPLSDDSNYRRINATAASTVDADPPVAWVAEHYSVLTDVLRASFLYFTHPVNVAASLLMPPGGRLECRIGISMVASLSGLLLLLLGPASATSRISLADGVVLAVCNSALSMSSVARSRSFAAAKAISVSASIEAIIVSKSCSSSEASST
jgi:hypothetical protein